MGKTFILTTPLMGSHNTVDNSAIKAFQRLLKSGGYYEGPVDGIYGKGTAAAVFMAKTKLGYKIPDHAAGDLLYGYLNGTRTTAEMRALATKRSAAAAVAETLPQKVLDWYIANTGKKEEPPNSNHSFVTAWYGEVGPWCAMTGVMAYAQSGSKVFTKLLAHKYNWAYVPNIEHDARLGIHGLSVTKTPFPGCGICYDWPGESPGISDHFGIFEKWINKSAGTFLAREGNTAIGNDSNGGEVMQRERNLSTVRAFIVVGG